MINPLLSDWSKTSKLPPYDTIDDSHFEQAIDKAMNSQNSVIESICGQISSPTFKNTVSPFLNSGNKITEILSIFYNLCATDSNKARDEIKSKMAPKIAAHFSKIYQNSNLFKRIDDIWKSKSNIKLSRQEERVVTLLRRDFVRSGVSLQKEKKLRFQKIQEKLALLGTQFSQNILKDEKSWFLSLSQEDVSDLPNFLILDMKKIALERNEEGYCLSLNESLIVPFLKFSSSRVLRKTVLEAWKARGLMNDNSNNKKIMKQTIQLRTELSNILGFETYSEYRLETEMAKKPEVVKNLLLSIWEATSKKVNCEAQDLTKLLHNEGFNGSLEPWDWRYYAEKKRATKYNFSEEDIKGFFQLDKLLDGIFYAVKRLFKLDCKITSIRGYHPDCKVIEITRDGIDLGLFIGDYFSRAGKRSGAWCSTIRNQKKINGVRVSPIVLNVCNFTKPQSGSPCLLSYDEAKTLFHEFGHALHQLLSDVDFEMIAGTNVPRDFVELPSQWFEHWLDSNDVMGQFAVSVKDGTSIPKELMNKLSAARSFNSGFDTMEYLASALVDIEIHSDVSCKDPFEKQREVLEKIKLHDAIFPRHQVEHFSHIFSGSGYASAYYSYIWSEMMDEDAFLAFEETGDLFDEKLAKSFEDNILAKGGSDEPEKLYKSFRGKLPTIEALIKSRNLERFV